MLSADGISPALWTRAILRYDGVHERFEHVFGKFDAHAFSQRIVSLVVKDDHALCDCFAFSELLPAVTTQAAARLTTLGDSRNINALPLVIHSA